MQLENDDTVCMVCLEDVTRQWINLEDQNTCEIVTISKVGEDIIEAIRDYFKVNSKKIRLIFGLILALHILWPIELNIVDIDILIK